MFSKRVNELSHSIPFFISEQAAKLKAQGRDISLFGAGETGFETPQFIKDAAKRAIDEGHTKYTAVAGILPLRRAICEMLKDETGVTYTPEQIVVSSGAKQSLWNIIYSLVNEGDEVIIIRPYWLTYAELVKLAGGIPVEVNDVSEIPAAITKKTKLVMICSPNNPDGRVLTEGELRTLARGIAKSGVYLMSDDMYAKLIFDGSKHFSIAGIYEKTIIVGGVSKSLAMTGWRIGWTACDAELTNAMTRFQSHTTSAPSSISQYAALEAIENKIEREKFITEINQSFGERRKYILERLKKIPNITFTEPQGAFYVLIDVRKFGTAFEIAEELLKKADVAVVPCETFGAPGHLRLSYTLGMEELQKGLDRLEKFFTQKETS